ncbi:AAA family ATPase [Streptomyces sp. NBC_00178]|uniref:AAA family ATPase n=1 Tax=Streptomyces sp. NBC_00178 TaxID=2975672 RepID=UPI002E2C2265|nr:AAA family ATPase [Streptomyces sp. NBC_00178]
MRISQCEIINYRGLRHASFTDIGDEPLIVVSGQNGTGKSLVLNALKTFWSNTFHGYSDIGPWGDYCSIQVSVTLTEEEWETCRSWAPRVGLPALPPKQTAPFQERMYFSKGQGLREDSMTTIMHLLRNSVFRESNSFATLDFLPAVRYFPLVSSPGVDLSLLSSDSVASERRELYNRPGPNDLASFPNVVSYLAALDYEYLLNQRQGVTSEDDYGVIQRAFHAATGKSLTRPEINPSSLNSRIEVRLPDGHSHGLEALSSGEQEMLGIMYYMRRLSASGGVLLIDEPEQHLHPTLQAALFSVVQNLADRAQVWAVTHSPKLLATAPASAAYQLRSPSESVENQVQRLQDEPSRRALISDLGITVAALLQSDFLLVVEGETDSKWLLDLLPVELGRAHVLVAGSGKDVLAAHRTLENSPLGIPWLCLIDRDLMDEAEVQAKMSRFSHLHIWPFREIESLFLNAKLIFATLVNSGYEVTEREVEVALGGSADDLQEDVIYQKTLKELNQLHPAPSPKREGGKYVQYEQYLRDYADSAVAKANDLNQVRSKVEAEVGRGWSKEWPVLVDPKAAISKIHGKFRCFANSAAFKDALTARIRLDESVRPVALEEFRRRITALLEAP